MLVRFLIFLACFFGTVNAQTVEDYIDKWHPTAIKQMESHGIPASITLAQGILESGFGTSYLALNGNNHFGIKCHDWKGAVIHKDDDKKNECFRKYHNAAQSYEDHSTFLTTRSRYAFLFELEKTDYKGWAHGLKKAGYATNPKYPDLLINLIEKHELYVFDQMTWSEHLANNENKLQSEETSLTISKDQPVLKYESNQKVSQDLNVTTKSTQNNKRQIHVNPNRTKYVIAKEGDTFVKLAKELNLTLRQLHKYNDFPVGKDQLIAGEKVYVMPKKRIRKKDEAAIQQYLNVENWQISQQHGFKLTAVTGLLEKSAFNNGDLVNNP
jgi:hypothetical protein